MKQFFLSLVVVLATCSPKNPHGIKNEPEHINPVKNEEIQVLTKEFFKLGEKKGIKFKNNVTIGLKDIKSDKTIGLCTYTAKWREIDLDSNYWARATWLSKIALVYHELAHCYCERDHDWAEGKRYPTDFELWFDNIINETPLTPLKPEGYMEDGCPMTLMHPTIIDDYCTKAHYAHYVKEMFDRCEPY